MLKLCIYRNSDCLEGSLCGVMSALACCGRDRVFDYIAELCRRLYRAALSLLHYRGCDRGSKSLLAVIVYYFFKVTFRIFVYNLVSRKRSFLVHSHIDGGVVHIAESSFRSIKLIAAASKIGENASEIHGLSSRDAQELLDCGIDLLTLGNHAFGCRDIGQFLDDHPTEIIRPANYPAACPGVGYTTLEVSGLKILCMNLSGTAFMDPLDNPFTVVDRILDREKGDYDIALLDFHAEATSEKLAMGYHLDGRVQIVFGTHTHVPTADTRVLRGGTGYVTDLGMTGPVNGILGTDKDAVLYKMTTHMPTRFTVADGPIEAHAALFELDNNAPHHCVRVERVVF